MKQFNFLSALMAVLLMVTAVSCTTLQGATDDEYYSDYRRTAPNRIYVEDPYYGTVVLEKDPYSGRYYQVSPYGGYSNRYAYNNRYGSDYRAPRNRNRNYSNSNRNNYPSASQGQAEQQKTQQQEKREEARRKVLGSR